MTDRDTYTRRDGVRIGLTPTEAMVVDILAEHVSLSAGAVVSASAEYRDPPSEREILQALDNLVSQRVLHLQDAVFSLRS